MTHDSFESEARYAGEHADQPSVFVRALEPLSRALFIEAGIEPGMRVLDTYSGLGDVALLVRDIVGGHGHVVGFDSDASTVAKANDRAKSRSHRNVEFVPCEIQQLQPKGHFDAVVGRFVLMFRSDPAEDVRALARCLAPGGVVVFQEMALTTGRTYPTAPAVRITQDWVLDAFERAGVDIEMGPKLYAIFKEAGLAAPKLRVDGLASGAEGIMPALIANSVRALVRQMEALDVISAEEVEIDTLEERMPADLVRTGGIVTSPLYFGCWAKSAE